MRRRLNGWLALPTVVRLLIGIVAGLAYFVLLVALSVVLASAGHGIIFPFALSSPFAVGGLVSWPVVGALLAVGGRAVRAAKPVLALHFTAGLVYFSLSPARSARPDFASPYLWIFGLLFIVGQVVIWMIAAKNGKVENGSENTIGT